MVAALTLAQEFDPRAALPPLCGKQPPKAIHCGFVEAGRFRAHEPAEQPRHFLLLAAQAAEEVSREVCSGHGAAYASNWGMSRQRFPLHGAFRI
jgi:hypothetical protein